jgi:hypothetical protein
MFPSTPTTKFAELTIMTCLHAAQRSGEARIRA